MYSHVCRFERQQVCFAASFLAANTRLCLITLHISESAGNFMTEHVSKTERLIIFVACVIDLSCLFCKICFWHHENVHYFNNNKVIYLIFMVVVFSVFLKVASEGYTLHGSCYKCLFDCLFVCLFVCFSEQCWYEC